MRNKRNLTAVLAIFCFILAVGIVWAATRGMLTFSGTVHLNSSVELEIVTAKAAVSKDSSEECKASVSFSGAEATLVAELASVNDEVNYTFSIKNIGNVDAKIKGMTVVEDDFNLDTKGVEFVFEDLKDEKIGPNATEDCKITIKWVDDNTYPLTATYKVALDYEMSMN